jgi:hypothetical protein
MSSSTRWARLSTVRWMRRSNVAHSLNFESRRLRFRMNCCNNAAREKEELCQIKKF